MFGSACVCESRNTAKHLCFNRVSDVVRETQKTKIIFFVVRLEFYEVLECEMFVSYENYDCASVFSSSCNVLPHIHHTIGNIKSLVSQLVTVGYYVLCIFLFFSFISFFFFIFFVLKLYLYVSSSFHPSTCMYARPMCVCVEKKGTKTKLLLMLYGILWKNE